MVTRERPTLEAVARRAGVSRATVSRVVNGSTTVAMAICDAVNQAVVITFILIFFANFVMTSLYFALVPQKF